MRADTSGVARLPLPSLLGLVFQGVFSCRGSKQGHWHPGCGPWQNRERQRAHTKLGGPCPWACSGREWLRQHLAKRPPPFLRAGLVFLICTSDGFGGSSLFGNCTWHDKRLFTLSSHRARFHMLDHTWHVRRLCTLYHRAGACSLPRSALHAPSPCSGPGKLAAWILLALQLLVGMSQWEVLGEIRGRRRERWGFLFSWLLCCGAWGAVSQFPYERCQLLSESLPQSYRYSPVWVPVTITFPYPFRSMNY